MPLESITSQEQEQIKPGVTIDDINNRKTSIELSHKLALVNDVLKVLDLPDKYENLFSKTLNTLDNKTLENLTKKSDKEIIIYLKNKKNSNNELKDEELTSKISKIKSVFTPEILDKFPKIAEQFELLETTKDKKDVLEKIIDLLKENDGERLNAIIKNLGGASINNPKYLEFRTALIEIDPTLEDFLPFERLNSTMSLTSQDIVGEIEKESGGLESINLDSKTPTSKLSLAGSSYSFEKVIDKQALGNLENNYNNKLEEVEKSGDVLKEVYTPFGKLLKQVAANWNKLDFKENIKGAVSNFPNEFFGNLSEVYKTMNIKSDIQINQADILALANSKNPNELKQNIDNIKEKLVKIQTHILEKQAGILKEYKQDMRELVSRKEEAKEKQVEVLEFMRASGFDLIPKSITNQIISQIQGNKLKIPGLDLSVTNIDLENGHFGESSAFIDKNEGLNIQAKTNLVKFVNKAISGSIDDPLSVKAIAGGTAKTDLLTLKTEFEKAGLVGGLGWKYSRIKKNLENKKVS